MAYMDYMNPDVLCPQITSTPYAVLPLFATRFAACTGGIWITIIESYLI